MYSLLFTLALFGQAEIGVPPAPAAEVAASPALNNAEEMRTWLLARLVIDLSFNETKSAEAQRMLANMNVPQLNALVAAYKERNAKPISAPKPPLDTTQSPQSLDQAKLNLQQLEAYRDHLKREYDRSILQGQMTQNLVYQNIVNQQMMMYRTSGPFLFGGNGGYGGYGGFGGGYGFSPLGYGGLGYGVMNYGGGGGYAMPMYGGGFY